MPRAAPSRSEEGEKQADKKARFNGRNEFPATWSAIASALFSAPFVNTPSLRRVVRSSVYAGIILITSTYSLRATNHRASEVYALPHPMQSGERQAGGKTQETRD